MNICRDKNICAHKLRKIAKMADTYEMNDYRGQGQHYNLCEKSWAVSETGV